MKKLYRNTFDQITPPDTLADAVFSKLESPRRRFSSRPLVTVCALTLVVSLATPVMAAYIPSFLDLMYSVAPETAARFSPIQESDSKSGITMEVVSTSIHGSTAEVYLGFTDQEGNRLNHNTLVEDFELLGRLPNYRSGHWGGSSRLMEYRQETGQLLKLIQRNYSFQSEETGKMLTVKELFGDKLTVHVERLYNTVPLEPQELPLVLTPRDTFQILLTGFRPTAEGYANFTFSGIADWVEQGQWTALVPGEVITQLTDEIALTGIAYADGKLHIQLRTQARDKTEAPSFHLSLRDHQDNPVRPVQLGFDCAGASYQEHIYDIPEEELTRYRLTCTVSEKQYIEGPWRVTFPLVESDYQEPGESPDGSILEEAFAGGKVTLDD